MARGLFISVEGIDGAGKSSHIQKIAQALEHEGHNVVLTREPGGTELAEKIRELLLHDGMDALTETLLAFAGRRNHLIEKIIPALEQGNTVISDRFTDATFAYQGAGRNMDWQCIALLERWVQTDDLSGAYTFYEPDFTILFDVPSETAAARLKNSREPDRFESEAASFFDRVSDGYEHRAQAAPARFIRIDANQSKEHVYNQVQSALVAHGLLSGISKGIENSVGKLE